MPFEALEGIEKSPLPKWQKTFQRLEAKPERDGIWRGTNCLYLDNCVSFKMWIVQFTPCKRIKTKRGQVMPYLMGTWKWLFLFSGTKAAYAVAQMQLSEIGWVEFRPGVSTRLAGSADVPIPSHYKLTQVTGTPIIQSSVWTYSNFSTVLGTKLIYTLFCATSTGLLIATYFQPLPRYLSPWSVHIVSKTMSCVCLSRDTEFMRALWLESPCSKRCHSWSVVSLTLQVLLFFHVLTLCRNTR